MDLLDNSCLLTIDMQADFYRPDAPLPVDGTAEVLPALQRVAAAYRKAALPIVHAVRLYLADGSNAEPVRRELVRSKNVVRPGSAGSQLAPELLPPGGCNLDPDLLLDGKLQPVGPREWIMYKPRWGAFYRTELESHLHSLGVETVVVVGCNFPNCPRTTLYEASERDFATGLVSDAVSGVYDVGLGELVRIGAAVMTADELVERVAGRD